MVGPQIPAWYHKETGEMYVGMEAPADSENWVQDSDVLDTWFSSALWPFQRWVGQMKQAKIINVTSQQAHWLLAMILLPFG